MADQLHLCGARGRHTPSCNQPAMPNGRCRLHGGCMVAGARMQLDELKSKTA